MVCKTEPNGKETPFSLPAGLGTGVHLGGGGEGKEYGEKLL